MNGDRTKTFVLFFLMMISMPLQVVHADNTGECVILLHGLARTKASMNKLANHLEGQGYTVVNMDYPSRKHNIQTLAKETVAKAVSLCEMENSSTIHFVTHSMGGILLRQYLADADISHLGRVVMLSPPNGGSEVVDRLKDLWPFQWLNGPAGQQLGTDETSVPRTLGPADFELGVITGDRSINLLLSLLIPGDDDGKVAVNNARLSGMKDFLVVHATHPFIMKNKKVMEQVVLFLRTGYFFHSDERL